MPLQSAYIEEEERLDLSFIGDLDITLSRDICGLCRQTNAGLKSCIIDLTGAKRIFDSGLALLQLLYRHLKALGAMVVILAEHPKVQDCVPIITRA